MQHDRRNEPNFNRIVEMGNSEALIQMASDLKTPAEHRESALIHLIYFIGRISDDKIESVATHLVGDKDEDISGMAQDLLNILNLVRGRTEDVDFLINLLSKEELSDGLRIGVEMVASRHVAGARGKEILSAFTVSQLREDLEKSDEIYKLEKTLRAQSKNKSRSPNDPDLN